MFSRILVCGGATETAPARVWKCVGEQRFSRRKARNHSPFRDERPSFGVRCAVPRVAMSNGTGMGLPSLRRTVLIESGDSARKGNTEPLASSGGSIGQMQGAISGLKAVAVGCNPCINERENFNGSTHIHKHRVLLNVYHAF